MSNGDSLTQAQSQQFGILQQLQNLNQPQASQPALPAPSPTTAGGAEQIGQQASTMPGTQPFQLAPTGPSGMPQGVGPSGQARVFPGGIKPAPGVDTTMRGPSVWSRLPGILGIPGLVIDAKRAAANEKQQKVANLTASIAAGLADPNPKVQELAKKLASDPKNIRLLEKAQRDPNSPEYLGVQQAHQQMQAEEQQQQQAQMVQQQKEALMRMQMEHARQYAAQAQTAQTRAEAPVKTAEIKAASAENIARFRDDIDKQKVKTYKPAPDGGFNAFNDRGDFVRHLSPQEAVDLQAMPMISSRQQLVDNGDGSKSVVDLQTTRQRGGISAAPAGRLAPGAAQPGAQPRAGVPQRTPQQAMQHAQSQQRAITAAGGGAPAQATPAAGQRLTAPGMPTGGINTPNVGVGFWTPSAAPAGGGRTIYTNQPIVAIDPQTGLRRVSTGREAAQKGWTSQGKINVAQMEKAATTQRQFNDVQSNVSRYVAAAKRFAMEGKGSDAVYINAVINEAKIGGGLKMGPLGNVEFPGYSSLAEAADRVARSGSYGALSKAGKDLVDGYLRTASAVPAYQKALTNVGRFNAETMHLELANIPDPTYAPADILRKLTAFQENIDQGSAGLINVAGIPTMQDTREKFETPTIPTSLMNLLNQQQRIQQQMRQGMPQAGGIQ